MSRSADRLFLTDGEIAARRSDIKDYSVHVTIRNNYLLTRMRSGGFESAAQLSAASGVSQGAIGEFLNLSLTAKNSRGQWREPLYRLATFFRCLPEDLIPPQHHTVPLEQNTAETTLSANDIRALQDNRTPESDLEARQQDECLARAMEALPTRDRFVLTMYYGLDGQESHTLCEIGRLMGVSAPRVRAIGLRAMRTLKSSDQLREAASAAR